MAIWGEADQIIPALIGIMHAHAARAGKQVSSGPPWRRALSPSRSALHEVVELIDDFSYTRRETAKRSTRYPRTAPKQPAD